MKKKKISSKTDSFIAHCHYCGSTVGQISDRTEESVTAVYDCPKCSVNYCDQCSYEENSDGKSFQFCLRCDSKMEKVM